MTYSLASRRTVVRRTLFRAVALFAFAALCPAIGQAQTAAPPALVLVVRHAEKVDNSADPALSETGMARARALAEALVDAKIDHVIVTQRQRTRLTAVPAMNARGLAPEEIGFGASMDAHVAAVAAAARKQAGKVVLIVGHSNTVPAIVHALGGPKLPDLCDARYASLFTVVPGAAGTEARVIVSSFGVPDAPSAMTCAGMVPR
jgi:broad specificity phosphatase PhoE